MAEHSIQISSSQDVVRPLIAQQLRRAEEKGGEEATQPSFNNQNTIIMAARSSNGDIMLMHETRIFYFKRDEQKDIHSLPIKSATTTTADDINYVEAVDQMTNLLLAMLTTRKYRLLTSFYLLWRILDYGLLFALIATTVFDGKHDTFQSIIYDKKIYPILLVVALEIFYDVLEFIVKIWLLNRVSIYIGTTLYIIYGAVIFIDHKRPKRDTFFVATLFTIRALSFIFEEIVDFCIDLELEYDLTEKIIHKLEVPICIKTDHEERIAIRNVSPHHNTIDFAKGWDFKGTICVWTWQNTFKCHVNRKENIKHSCIFKLYRFIFHLMFGITYCIIGIPLLLIFLFYIGILTLFARICCCGGRKNTICDECLSHRYSY